MYVRFRRNNPARRGVRQLTAHKTTHCLRPTRAIVSQYLKNVSESAWRRYERLYRQILAKRFLGNRKLFDKLAAMARARDVFLGCYCPTKTNPNPDHCHTRLALKFMKEKYPDLDIDLKLVRN
jgi:hypothetical protein